MLERHPDTPVLDYDTSPVSAFQTDKGQDLPASCLITSFGDVLQSWITEFGGKERMRFSTEMRDFPVYTVTHRDRTLALTQLCEGAGMAALQTEFLISRGVKTILLADSCGALVPGQENGLYLPGKALRDEGVSYKYLPAAPFAEFSDDLIRIGRAVLSGNETEFTDGPAWTNEVLFRITREELVDRLERGCVLTDRCSASLGAVTRFRGARFAPLFCAGYTLGQGFSDEEPEDSRVKTFCLALDILARADGEEDL